MKKFTIIVYICGQAFVLIKATSHIYKLFDTYTQPGSQVWYLFLTQVSVFPHESRHSGLQSTYSMLSAALQASLQESHPGGSPGRHSHNALVQVLLH